MHPFQRTSARTPFHCMIARANPFPKQEHARVLMIRCVLMAYVFVFNPLVTISWFASRYRAGHNKHCHAFMEGRTIASASQARNAFVNLCHKGVVAVEPEIDMPKLVADAGCFDPAAARLRVPFVFHTPYFAAPAAPEPKPKSAPKVQRQTWHYGKWHCLACIDIFYYTPLPLP